MSVSRPLRSTVPLPRSTGRSTGPCLCTSCTRSTGLCPSVDRAVDQALSKLASSVVLAHFGFRSLCYLPDEFKKLFRCLLSPLSPLFLHNVLVSSQIERVLEMPFHWGMRRLEARHHLTMYLKEDTTRNHVLLELAMLDVKLLQSLHQTEIKALSMYVRVFSFFLLFSFLD